MSAQPLEVLIDEMERTRAELARRSLKRFVALFWHLVEPVQPLMWNWHLDEICRLLESMTKGEITKAIINVPPGTMKSLLVNVFWPAWEWASMPWLRMMTISYGDTIVIDLNLKMKNIVTSDLYQRNYGLRLKGDQNSKEKFETTQQGWQLGTTVDGAATGFHADRIRVDDPIKASKAEMPSEADLNRVINWAKNTISTRGITRDVRIVVIMQRLHKRDLSGYLLGQGGWFHLCFPMEYEPPLPKEQQTADYRPPDPRDHRWEAGQLLWPELFTREKVRLLKIDLGPYGAAGQLQQRPAPKGGGLFKRTWFKIIEPQDVPSGGTECRGWDIGGSKPEKDDYTAGVKMRRIIQPKSVMFIITHVIHDHFTPAEVDLIMKHTARLDGSGCRQREEREPGSSGKAVTSVRAAEMAGIDYTEVIVSKDKVTRARPFRAQAEMGNVYLVRAGWNEEFLDEIEQFPVGENDDQVDASSTAFNELTSGPQPIQEVEVLWGG